MHRLLKVLRDPVAWILVIAGVVELLSGGTAARGAILFAGAGLILADRIRVGLVRARAGLGYSGSVSVVAAARPPIDAAPLQAAVNRRSWIVGAVVAALLVALVGVHTLPLTATTGALGILAVGWAWLTQPVAPPLRRFRVGGLLAWAGVFLALGLWELSALLGQPTLAESSYDHPTISYLLDPVFATYVGRFVGLCLWAALGRSLVRRS
jgi:hypothetical protein